MRRLSRTHILISEREGGTRSRLRNALQSRLTRGLFFDSIEMVRQIVAKPSLVLYQMASDAFFARNSPTVLFGAPIDMAFLDGLHRCEYLLRDFINTERHCRRNSVIALHDCLPVEGAITTRVEKYDTSTHPDRKTWWAGDVW